MTRKLTISLDDHVYAGLHALIGRGNIGKFLESLARPFVLNADLAASYAEMTAHAEREAEADDWVEFLAGDSRHASW